MENQRTLKQNYLVDNIINMGYDSNDFENFVMQASNNSDGFPFFYIFHPLFILFTSKRILPFT